MSHDFNIAEAPILPCIDDSDLSVVLPRVLSTIPDVDKLRFRFVDNSVRSRLQVNRVEKFQSVPLKHSQHPVISAGHKQLLEFRDVQGALRLLESGKAAHPLTGLQIH